MKTFKLLLLLILVASCSSDDEPVCDCEHLEWEYVTTGAYQLVDQYSVDCTTPITLADAVDAAPLGSDVVEIKCYD